MELTMTKQCYLLSEGHIKIIDDYMTRWNYSTKTEAVRSILNDISKQLED